jgi:hypothetical protein
MTTQWLRSPCADDANAEESGAPSCDRRHLVGLQEGHHLLRVRPETSGGQVTEEDVQHGAEQRSGPDHAAVMQPQPHDNNEHQGWREVGE